MNMELLNLLEQDIYTDAPEYAGRVATVKELVSTLRAALATETLIQEARYIHQTDDVEIDDFGVETSRADESEGTWVAAWVWVADSDLEPGGKPRGEQ